MKKINNLTENLRLRSGSLRGRRSVVEIGEESPITEEEVPSVERGEFEEL